MEGNTQKDVYKRQTQGEGDERIVRRIERNFLPGGKWEMIESYRKINEETPVSCVRTVQKLSLIHISRTC